MKAGARILIAGCGYVGSAAAERLRDAGHQVFGVRRNIAALPAGIEPVAMDLHTSNLDTLPRDLDAVVWSLAPNRGEASYRQSYVQAPARLFDFLHARGDQIQRTVLLSSTSVWHRTDGAFVDECTPPSPADYRGELVLAGEQIVRDAPFRSVSLRLTGIYGPGRTRMLDGIRHRRIAMPTTAAYGNRIHRDDAAKAVAHILSLADPDDTYIVVDDDPADLRDVYTWLAERMDVAPPSEAAADDADRPDRRGNKRCRNDRLCATGWRPDVPDYRSGYAAMLNDE